MKRTGQTLRVRSRRGGPGGFTLLDMIVTLMVFSLLGLMARPVFSEMMDVFELHGAARQVFAEMQRARMTAISENTRCRAKIDKGALLFERFDADSSEWTAMTEQDLAADDTEDLTLAVSDTITFVPNGATLGAGTITLSDVDGNSRVITVSAAGAIRVD